MPRARARSAATSVRFRRRRRRACGALIRVLRRWSSKALSSAGRTRSIGSSGNGGVYPHAGPAHVDSGACHERSRLVGAPRFLPLLATRAADTGVPSAGGCLVVFGEARSGLIRSCRGSSNAGRASCLLRSAVSWRSGCRSSSRRRAVFAVRSGWWPSREHPGLEVRRVDDAGAASGGPDDEQPPTLRVNG